MADITEYEKYLKGFEELYYEKGDDEKSEQSEEDVSDENIHLIVDAYDTWISISRNAKMAEAVKEYMRILIKTTEVQLGGDLKWSRTMRDEVERIMKEKKGKNKSS